MAESREERPPHKRNYYVHRSRPSPQTRLYHNLGVRDLRELLDRKRSERSESEVAPPSDPSFNYLKDPLRDNEKHSRRPHNKTSKEQNKDIENPLNIKVEFSTSTGEHSYKLDESTVLPTIKHIPDQVAPQFRSFRGRGRGRFRGQRSYRSRAFRNNSSNKSNEQTTSTFCDNEEENWDNDEASGGPKEVDQNESTHELVEQIENLKIMDGAKGVAAQPKVQQIPAEK